MKERFIWVAGADGMLGSTFCLYLKKKKIKFVSSTVQDVDICIEDQIDRFVEGKNLTHIVNCVGYTQVDLAEKEADKAFKVNAKAPAYLAKTAKRKKTRFIHFSTDYVFDGTKLSSYSEEETPNPINVYGESKYQGEKGILQEFPLACIIRTSWLFGRGENNFVAKMLDLIQKKEQLSIVDDQIGRFTYAQDLAEATFNLLDREGIYHFSNEDKASWHDMVLYLYQFMVSQGKKITCKRIKPIKAEDYPTPARRPSCSILNTLKYEKFAKTKPRTWKNATKAYLEERER